MHDLEGRLRRAAPRPPDDPAADERAHARFTEELRRQSGRARRVPRGMVLIAAALAVSGTAVAVVSQQPTTLSSGERAGAPQDGGLAGSGQVAVWSEEAADGTSRVVAASGEAVRAGSRHHVLAIGGSSPAVADTGPGSAIAAWATPEGIHSAELADGAWSEPQPVPGGGERDIIRLRLSHGPSGTVIASWEEIGVPQRASTATYSPKTGWSTAQALPTPRGASGFTPVIAQGPDGTALAVWQTLVGRAARIMASHATPAGWSPPVALTTSRSAGDPDVSFDDRGRAYVVWSGLTANAERFGVHLAVRDPQGVWSPTRQLNGPGQQATEPVVTGLSAGAMAAWATIGDDRRAHVQAARVAGDGAITQLPQPVSPGSRLGLSVALTRGAGDRVVAAWARRTGAGTSSLEVAAVAPDAQNIQISRVPTRGVVIHPAATLTEDGDISLLWTELSGDRSEARAARLADPSATGG